MKLVSWATGLGMLLSRTALIERAADAVPIVDLRPRAPDLKYACRVSSSLHPPQPTTGEQDCGL